jgi:hypothetical protein
MEPMFGNSGAMARLDIKMPETGVKAGLRLMKTSYRYGISLMLPSANSTFVK